MAGRWQMDRNLIPTSTSSQYLTGQVAVGYTYNSIGLCATASICCTLRYASLHITYMHPHFLPGGANMIVSPFQACV